MKTIKIGKTVEKVVERKDFPEPKLRKALAREVFVVIGYGVQGRAQSQNLRDNGAKVVVAVRPGPSWKLAEEDGWVPGKTLLPVAEAVRKGTVVMFLSSDAGQKAQWPEVRANLQKGAALYFSHGFSVVYAKQTGVKPPKDVDVILVAPKGSGTTVRRLFLQGRGINASIAVHQDFTGRARERVMAAGIGIGAGFLFETTFAKEVYSDLTGERGVLMGAIYGLWRAQYDLLRRKGHSPLEAFNETVEEATQSLYPLIGERGMDWMYANCSATAQRGALDWHDRFAKAARPVFEKLYNEVRSGRETVRVLRSNSRPDYRKGLEKELKQIRESEMWLAGKEVRALRPENQKTAARGKKKRS
jgi:ketol-acid reductoisomerase